MTTASDDRPWLAAYAPGVPADIAVPTKPLTALLDQSVQRYGPRVALDFMGATTTYGELGRQVARAAEALRRLGVTAGDRVGLALPNCPQHVVAFYAVLRLRAIVVEHNPLYTQDELARQLADHGARFVICWEKLAETIRATAADTGVRTIIAVDLTAALPWSKRLALALPLPKARRMRAEMRGARPAGVLSWERLVAAAPPLDPSTPQPGVDDVALLQYTGGTTGTPKGAILTHRNLAANAAQGRAWVPGLHDGEETIFAILPFFHAYGLTLCLTFAIQVGASLVLLPRFDADQFLAAARRRAPTFLPGVPPMFDRIAEAARRSGTDLTSIRYAISGAMALPDATVQRWEDVTGGLLVEGYGMTETSPVAIGNPMAPSRRRRAVGVPFPSTRVRIVDPEDVRVDRPRGERGELLIQGPQVFRGYWRRPDETAVALLPGGWIRTGDIAIMDNDGFITIVDRIKEMIITGGFNVYPSEVEDVLRTHPDIADAAVVGEPTADGGEQVVAAVVPVEGAAIDPEDIRIWCREHVAGYKAPRRIVAVGELAHDQIGKVRRRQVRETLLRTRT